MLCPNCQVEFNSSTNIPRILIFCGHTFCHNCIEQLLALDSQSNKWQLECPECSTVNIAADGVNSFPKNLVLLQVQNQSNIQNTSANNSSIQQNQVKKDYQNSDKNRQDLQMKQQQQQQQQQQLQQQQQAYHQQDSQKVLCQLHNKKLEAFCEKDLQVLCIDCILSDQHKSHEIISVQKAAEKQRQILYDEVTGATKTEEKLKFIQNDIKRHIGEMHSQAEKNRKELSQIYSYVRDLLLEREQTLKRQISENLTREESESEQKQSEISEFISTINLLKQELLSQNQESEIEILQKARPRTLLSSEVNGAKSRDIIAFNLVNLSQASQSLTEIKRDQELTQISKILNPTYKGPTIGQTLGSAQSNLYQHTQSTANKIKKAGTQVQSQISNNLNGLMPQPQFNPILVTQSSDKQKDELKRVSQKPTINNNATKSKVSPNRVPIKQQTQLYQPNKKQGVTVLDQNKQKPQPQQQQSSFNKPHVKNQGSFNNHLTNPNQINLYNYNQYNQQFIVSQNMGNQGDDMCQEGLGNLGGDDVSSIYPLETNEMYYQYQDNQNTLRNGNKRDESVGALENILDSLNKSANHEMNSHDIEKQASSTASETGGSQQDIKTPPTQDLRLKSIKNQVESPKQRKNNPWRPQNNVNKQNKSGKKCMKKDNSTTDLDDFKMSKNRLINVNQCINEGNQQYRGFEEKKSSKRNSSLHRYSSSNNNVINNDSPTISKDNFIYANQYDDSDTKNQLNLVACSVDNLQYQNNNQNAGHQLQSLSLERAKRKQQKMNEVFSNEQSPFKDDSARSKDFDKNQILDMLNQCSKNIDSMNFKPISRKNNLKQSNSHQDSPIKQQSINSSKAAVCLVDLTKKDEDEKLLMRVLSPDERDLIKENEEQEGNSSKNLPNATNQKDQSPFKHGQNIHHSNSEQSYHSSPQKQQVIKSTESLDNLMTKNIRNQDNSFELKNQPFNLATDSMLQQSVSVDTSVSDPFRALCRVKEEFIFVFSGFNDQKLLTCEALDIQRGTWKEIAQIGKARTKFSAVPISKSRILIFGGKQADGSRTGDIEEYNLKTNKFKTLPFKLPKAKSGFSSCVKREEGKIFFCGGNCGSVLKKFDCLDLKKGKWSRWPEMIQKRDELAVALGPDGKIYAIGGYGGGSANYSGNQQDENNTTTGKGQTSNCLRTAERFDFNTGQWEMLPEMNEARRALAAVALPDGIYAIGGYDGKQYLSSVEKFDLQKQQWVTVKSMNTSRCTLSAVVSSDCQFIYALGGFNGNSLDLVERYNTMTDEWEFVTPMISKRFMHEAVCLVTH